MVYLTLEMKGEQLVEFDQGNKKFVKVEYTSIWYTRLR